MTRPSPGPRSGSRTRSFRGRRRGIALVSVVAVLVLLMIVATPFLISMRDSAYRGERVIYSDRANAEAESLFEQVRGHLATTVEHVERHSLDALGTGASAQGDVRPPSDATPSADTPDEFALPASVLAEMNVLAGNEHRVWDVEIRDAQARFNLNSCSFGILANLLGGGELTAAIESGDERITVSDVTGFPLENGVVRIGTEVIRYETANPKTNMLEGCERGYLAGRPECGPAKQHDIGAFVMLEAAVQIGMRPFRRTPGVWTRYTNVYEARAVSEMGVAALEPEAFDRIRRFLTCWNGNAVGDGWSNPQQVRNAINAGARAGDLYVQVKNIRYFGPGTVVMLTDGVNRDYGVVVNVRGTDQVEILGDIRFDYPADQTRIYCLARAPINVNTADAETLALCFRGLKLRGKESRIDRRVANSLASYLKGRRVEAETESGVYRSWDDFVTALEQARDADIVNGDEFEAVLKNALNPNDSTLQFSTVPFVFRSYDVYEARVTATLLGIQGQERARRELLRTFEVSTGRSSTFVAETQAEFQEQIRLSRDGKWFSTFPTNVTSFYEGKNIPPSEYLSYATRQRFPDTDRASGVGHVQLSPGAFRFTNRDDRFLHFDEQEEPDGIDLDEQSLELSVVGPYSAADKKADLIAFAEVPGRTDEVELGMKPFACSFWYKPRWDQDSGDHFLFDYGDKEPQMNRVALRYVGDRKALVLSVWDATREQRGCDIEAPVGPGTTTTFEKDKWYHVAVAVHGCSPEQMSLFVDAEQQGKSLLSTKLTSSIPPIGGITSIGVEDASGFPDQGVLLVHADEGVELIEYSGRSDSSFSVRRRKARSLNVVLDVNQEAQRTTPSGSRVTLYGFTAPLLTDVKRGGASTDTNFGPWRAFRCNGTDVGTLVFTGGQPPSSSTFLLAGIARIDGYQPVVTLTEWDTGAADSTILDDLGGQGAEGIAMIVSPVYAVGATGPSGTTVTNPMQVTGGGNNGQNDAINIGGPDIVRYRVGQSAAGGLEVTLLQQGLTLRHYDSSVWTSPANANGGRFIPTYDWGYTTPHPLGTQYLPFGFAGDPYNGSYTAFIPIALSAQTSGDYLDPCDSEPQLGSTGPGTYSPGSAFVQVDGEWFKYDTFDRNILPGKVSFYRDLRLDDVANLFPNASRVPVTVTNPQQSGGVGGGGGQQSSNSEPPPAQDYNDAANGLPPPAGNAVDANEQPPPITSFQLAQALDFRSWENRNTQVIHTVANTLPDNHTTGTVVVPCFALTPGDQGDFTVAGKGAYGGFNDLLTLRDLRGSDEQIRLQWGYRNWVAPISTAPLLQDWRWDRVQFAVDLRRWPSRAWTRALKFPSGEMPDSLLTTNQEKVKFGKRFDGEGAPAAMVDELAFLDVKAPEDDVFRDQVLLGEVPAQLTTPSTTTTALRFIGIDEKTDEIPIFWQYYDEANRLLVINGLGIHGDVFPDDGGVIRIDEELIFYSEVDRTSGKLKGCLRGCFGTEAEAHRYGSSIVPVESFATTRLTADADEQTATFQLDDNADFPEDGYIRIADLGEVIGYTEWQPNVLTGPLRRIDPTAEAATEREEETGRRVGGGLFRARFSTQAAAYQTGDVVMAMPFRHYDRYAERSDDPENSYVQFTWTKRNAVWKRITWDELPKENIEVIAHVRFPGGPEWDADKVVRVGQQGMPPAAERRAWIYEIVDAKAENLLNVEADRVEVRLLVRFAKGAYDRFAETPPDSWKETPEIRKVVVEYVAPSAVLSQE